MKIFKKLLVAGGAASIAFTACSIVDEYDQELVDRYEQAVQDEKDSVKQAEQDRKDSIANLDSATCPETFTDTRDENVYDIVRIYDPEVDIQSGLTPSVDYNRYPRNRSYLFGFNLSF